MFGINHLVSANNKLLALQRRMLHLQKNPIFIGINQ